MKEIGVSILCLAFNHEEFIADAIEGFLMQKTDFPIEIIINEDASTDKTAEIIRKYERKYPDIIKPIYHKENQYSKSVNINKEFMLPKATGKYVALCDGDDFWTDPYKLQKQYDALENNPECLMCVHKVLDLDVRKKTTDNNKKHLPATDLETGVILQRDFFKILGKNDFFNEVCYFFNAKEYREYQNNYPDFASVFMKNKSDDAPMLYYFANKANVYYIADEMATYRRFTSGSWSDGMNKKNYEKLKQYFSNSVAAQEAFDIFSKGKYREELKYARSYCSFNKAYYESNYKEMLDKKYDCVWKKQSSSYKKRIEMLAKCPLIAKPMFRVYDKLKSIR